MLTLNQRLEIKTVSDRFFGFAYKCLLPTILIFLSSGGVYALASIIVNTMVSAGHWYQVYIYVPWDLEIPKNEYFYWIYISIHPLNMVLVPILIYVFFGELNFKFYIRTTFIVILISALFFILVPAYDYMHDPAWRGEHVDPTTYDYTKWWWTNFPSFHCLHPMLGLVGPIFLIQKPEKLKSKHKSSISFKMGLIFLIPIFLIAVCYTLCVLPHCNLPAIIMCMLTVLFIFAIFSLKKYDYRWIKITRIWMIVWYGLISALTYATVLLTKEHFIVDGIFSLVLCFTVFWINSWLFKKGWKKFWLLNYIDLLYSTLFLKQSKVRLTFGILIGLILLGTIFSVKIASNIISDSIINFSV